jgi:hypothetical protein
VTPLHYLYVTKYKLQLCHPLLERMIPFTLPANRSVAAFLLFNQYFIDSPHPSHVLIVIKAGQTLSLFRFYP